MKLETVLPESEFEHVRAAWNEAALGAWQADPFCCLPEWQLAFHEAFSPKRRLLIENNSGSLICFAEHVFSPADVYLTPIEVEWFFGCPLLGEHSVELLADALPFFATEYAPHFPKILISGIGAGNALAARLLETFSRDFAVSLHSRGLQCAASLDGGIDGYLSRRSRGFRKKLKSARSQAAERGVSFERVLPASREDAQAIYTRMLAVEEASWKGLNSCGMAESPPREFYAAMIRRLSRDANARVIMAKCDDKDIGFIFGGMAGGIYRGQQFSYDDEWQKFSIGNLMQFEQITWLCEENASRYDMGPIIGAGMDYKKHWTEARIALQCWKFERK